ncbi:hypothetical protein JK635_02000 [Neobacillus sp. YIM B02564]|uniref:Uncharacterized protein n=1 Tax=Neobacillus paridis TaxID=2803862 RepID=A0ABS1TIC3_9BACI|nr:hypothetical protein [Neobacillus paridis]MBL4951012.1 hypothetical protein [Neobacillus paridis]
MYKIKCQNCKGHGVLQQFAHVENGICFTCSGSGIQEVDKETYENYQKRIERDKQGKYILFNNGNVEYYNSEKQIEKLYGNFFCGSYGEYDCSVSYKDKNIAYGKSDENDKEFINEAKKIYKQRQNEKIIEQIVIFKEMLKGKTDQELVQIINNKIKELEGRL